MIATSIKDMRRLLRWSQAALAKEIGVSQANIAHYELSRNDPSPSVARRIISVAGNNGVQITMDSIYGVSHGSQKDAA